MAKSSRFNRYHTYELRGWIGVEGAILALIGFFLPYLRGLGGWLAFDSPSLYDSMAYGWKALVAVLFVGLLIGAGVAFWNNMHAVGCAMGVPFGLIVLLDVLGGTEIFSLGHIGFWFSFLGTVLMFAAPVVANIQCKIANSEAWSETASAPTTPVVEETEQQNTSAVCKLFNRVWGAIAGKERGWRELGAVVLTLVSFVLPFVGAASVSLYDFASAQMPAILVKLILVMLVGAGVAGWLCQYGVAILLVVPYSLVLYCLLFFMPGYILTWAGIGYWLSLVSATLALAFAGISWRRKLA